jgi:hypothetical protein
MNTDEYWGDIPSVVEGITEGVYEPEIFALLVKYHNARHHMEKGSLAIQFTKKLERAIDNYFYEVEKNREN